MMNLTVGKPTIIYDDNMLQPYITLDGDGGGWSGCTRDLFIGVGIENILLVNGLDGSRDLFGETIVKYSLIAHIVDKIIEDFDDSKYSIKTLIKEGKKIYGDDMFIQFS